MERRNSMRSFYAQFYKNLIWIYLCVLCCFGYNSMLSAIPDHVYLKEECTMEQKTLSLVLKLVLVGFAIAGALLYIWLLPMLGSDFVLNYPELQPWYLPWAPTSCLLTTVVTPTVFCMLSKAA